LRHSVSPPGDGMAHRVTRLTLYGRETLETGRVQSLHWVMENRQLGSPWMARTGWRQEGSIAALSDGEIAAELTLDGEETLDTRELGICAKRWETAHFGWRGEAGDRRGSVSSPSGG